MQKETVTVRKAAVTVRTQIGWDVSDSQIIYRKLTLCGYNGNDPIMSNRMQNFARCVTQSEIEGDLGIPWTRVSDPADVVASAFEAWGTELSPNENARWIAALIRVDEAPGDPDLAPNAGEKKESTQTSDSPAKS